MNIVSDQNEIIGKWDAGLKVYYVNTKGLTNKNINDYLKLLTDKTTISKKYKQTSSIKKEIYAIGGATMSKEMREILDSERAEGKAEGKIEGMMLGQLKAIVKLLRQGLISEEVALSNLELSKEELDKKIKELNI